MSVRKDKVQLDLEINGKKAGQTYAGLKKNVRDLNREINKLEPGTEEFRKKTQELQSANKRLREVRDQVRGIDRSLVGTIKSAFSFRNVIRGIGQVLPSLGIASLISNTQRLVSESIRLFDVQAKAEAQVKQGLESTGQVAGRTFEELKRLASELQEETIFGDEEILKGVTAQLLTFTNIAGEQFDRTQQAALDLATRLDGDLQSASIQLGKALNDPVANLSALSRSGIQFSEDQKAVIKELAETNRLAEAQTIILDELDKQYGGSAQAAAKAGTGGLQQYKNTMGDILEVVGEIVNVTLTNLQPALENFARLLGNIANFIAGPYRDLRTEAQKTIDTLKDQRATAEGLFSTLRNLNDRIEDLEEGTTDYNAAAEAKKRVIDDINRQYGAYLPNLLTEKSTLDEIRVAQQAVNQELLKKQLILSFQEEINAAIKAEIEARKNLAEIERQRAAGAAANAETDLLNIGGSPGQAQQLRQNLEIAQNAGETLNKQLIVDAQETQKEVNEIYAGLFEEIGVSFQEVLGQLNQTTQSQSATNVITRIEDPKKVKDQTDEVVQTRQESLRLGFERMNVLLEAQFVRGELTEDLYQEAVVENNRAFFNERIELLESYGDRYQAELDKIRNDALKFENDLIQQQRDQASDPNNILSGLRGDQEAAEIRIKQRFIDQLLSEEEFQKQLSQTQINFYNRQLELLKSYGLEYTSIYGQIQDQVLQKQKEVNSKKNKNEESFWTAVTDYTQIGSQAFSGFFDVSLNLLSRDEKARKDNAATIKAFQKGKILTNLASEISGYFTQFSAIPGGTIIAGILSGVALTRANNAIKDINAQEFYGGGRVEEYKSKGAKVISLYGYNSGGKIIPLYSSSSGIIAGTPNIKPTAKGDNMLAYVRTGETILNDDQIRKLGGPAVMRSIGVPGYASGGVAQPTTVSTQPRIESVPQVSDQNIAQEAVIAELRALREDFNGMNTNLKAYIVYNELEAKQNEVNSLRNRTAL